MCKLFKVQNYNLFLYLVVPGIQYAGINNDGSAFVYRNGKEFYNVTSFIYL